MKALPELFLRWILRIEGGYSSDPADLAAQYVKPGAIHTNMGITTGTLSNAIRKGIIEQKDITDLTIDDVSAIYFNLYYLPCKADQLDWPIDLVHFDSAVNHGIGGAGKLFQRTLNAVNDNHVIGVDGIVGPITLYEYNRILKDKTSVTDMSLLYLKKRKEYYEAIVRNRPSQKKFLRGWMNRLKWLSDECEIGYTPM
jgi:lysozyme family protein